MLKFLTFFIALLLLFNMSFAVLAQIRPAEITEETVDAVKTAKADANADVNKPLYCGLGCLLTAIPFVSTLVVDGSGTPSAVIGPPAVILGTYFYQPSPPPERLLGKPPTYINTYTSHYKSERGKTQALWTSAGCLTGGLIVGTFVLGVAAGLDLDLN